LGKSWLLTISFKQRTAINLILFKDFMIWLKEIIFGAIFGVANIIPGVSGGTMALIMGFYHRLIIAIQNITPRSILNLLGILKFNRDGIQSFQVELKRIDAFFLFRLFIGAVFAIVVLAKLMTYLLTQWHDPTYGFFFGLVLLSVVAPYRLISKITPMVLLATLIASVMVIGLSKGVSGDDLIKKAQVKQELKVQKNSPTADSKNQNQTYKKYLLFFVMGAIAISAMILPGVSGSFLLILMGGYFEMLSAIVNRDFILLGSFAFGCLIGLMVFTRFLNMMLKRFHDLTLAFLLGLVAGSLWVIWPFKSSVKIGEEIIFLDNIIPSQFGTPEVITTMTAIVGMIIVFVFLKMENKDAANI
jgi:putative membrane protein